MDIVRVNVGGTIFEVDRRTILNIPSSRLCVSLLTNKDYNNKMDMFFFDRRPGLFEAIVSAHRDGEVHVPGDGCGGELIKELDFWNLPDTMVAPCCVSKTRQAQTERDIARLVAEEICADPDQSLEIRSRSSDWQLKRLNAWLFMEFPVSSKFAKAWSIFMGLVLAGSLVTYGMMFDDNFMYRYQNGTVITLPREFFHDVVALIGTRKWLIMWTGRRYDWVYTIDVLLNVILTTEFIVRFALCPYKMKFMKSVETITAIIVFSSFLFSWVLGFCLTLPVLRNKAGVQWLWLAFTVLQMLRPFRIIGLANTFVSLRILVLVLRRSVSELCTIVMFLGIGMMLFAFLIFAAEVVIDDHFKTVWAGAWWAVVTMTTVGYGDMYPRSYGGYVVGVMCTICGMLIIGLSIPIISGTFSIYYDNVNMQMEKVKQKLRKALAESKTGRVAPRDVATTETGTKDHGVSFEYEKATRVTTTGI